MSLLNNNEYHGISKDEAVKKLIEIGIDAVYDKGIVHITIPDEDFEKGCEKMDKILKKIDYRMSHGYIHKKEEKSVESDTFEKSSDI